MFINLAPGTHLATNRSPESNATLHLPKKGRSSRIGHRDNGGTFWMVPLIINPKYTFSSRFLLGVSKRHLHSLSNCFLTLASVISLDKIWKIVSMCLFEFGSLSSACPHISKKVAKLQDMSLQPASLAKSYNIELMIPRDTFFPTRCLHETQVSKDLHPTPFPCIWVVFVFEERFEHWVHSVNQDPHGFNAQKWQTLVSCLAKQDGTVFLQIFSAQSCIDDLPTCNSCNMCLASAAW